MAFSALVWATCRVSDINVYSGGWASTTSRPKRVIIERLVPDVRDSRFFLPAICWHGNEQCEWSVVDDRVAFRPLQGEPDDWVRMRAQNEDYRIAKVIKRVDEEKQIYDVTEAFMQELSYFPFGTHDDLVDAASRIYDLRPTPPQIYDEIDLEPEVYVDT